MASQGGPSRAPLTPSQGIVSSTAAESRSAWFYFRSAREGERQKDGIRTILYCSMCEDPKYGTAHITNAKNHLTRRHQLDFLRTPAATATRAQLVANSLSNGTPRPRAPRINTTAGGVLSLFSLEGQLAVVTGGTRGIGQAMAIALAEAGADIILVQRGTTQTETKSKIEALGRKAYIYACDLTFPASVASLVPAIIDDGHSPNILLNCAGIQARHPAHQFPDSDWNGVIQVNLNAVFALCRDMGGHMLSRPLDQFGRRGSIINVASLLSFQGGVLVPAYAAAKGGVAQLTKALSNEWAGKGISVNAIAPGYIQTDMTEALVRDPDRGPSILSRIPAGRWGNPDDFKGVVVWLASRASSYVSGEIVTVDGGWMGR